MPGGLRELDDLRDRELDDGRGTRHRGEADARELEQHVSASSRRGRCARVHPVCRSMWAVQVRVLNIFRAEMFTPVFAISHGVRPISPGGARVARTARAALLSPRSGKKLGVLFRNRSIFVPRGLARRPLRLTGVRVQRWVRQRGPGRCPGRFF